MAGPGLDILPSLILLAGALAFYQYSQRQRARAAAAAAADVHMERRRSAELERLVALGAALGSALDAATLRQMFWRHVPGFARDRELWMLTRATGGWEHVVRDAGPGTVRPGASLEPIADEALRAPAHADTPVNGLLVANDVCFPMVVDETALGVVGVQNQPPLSPAERRAIGAAVALLAIAMRNVQLLATTRENSLRDQLTGCFNRAYAIEALTAEMQRARRNAQPVSVLMFDVDSLKPINDEHGHLVGDAVLAAIAEQMVATLRASDVKCRWGGDEFLVVLPDTPLAGAAHAGASLTREVSQRSVATSTSAIAPTISVGVASGAPGESDALALIARADAALYKAKAAGRNRFAVAAPIRAAS